MNVVVLVKKVTDGKFFTAAAPHATYSIKVETQRAFSLWAVKGKQPLSTEDYDMALSYDGENYDVTSDWTVVLFQTEEEEEATYIHITGGNG